MIDAELGVRPLRVRLKRLPARRHGFSPDILSDSMTEDEVLTIFRRSGALLEGHFRLSSGCTAPAISSARWCCSIRARPRRSARRWATSCDRSAPQTVLSPAIGGIVIGQEVGRALGVRAIFAERQDGALTLRRGFALEPGEKVLVVEDVVTTGGSTRETMDVARAAGAIVVGACAIVDRSGGKQGLDVPFHALLPMDVKTYQPERMPALPAGVPVVNPGRDSKPSDPAVLAS